MASWRRWAVRAAALVAVGLLFVAGVLGVVLLVGLGGRAQPAAGWAGFGSQDTHKLIAMTVIQWFDDDGWQFQGRDIAASEWVQVGDEADSEPDTDLIGRPVGAYHRVSEHMQEMCTVYGTDVRGCPYQQDWDAAEERAVHWAAMAKQSLTTGDQDQARRYAAWALHYVQDAVNPPHVDPWSEGGLLDCGSSSPHTSFEICVGENPDMYFQIDKNLTHGLNLPDGRAVDDRQTFTDDDNLMQATKHFAKETDKEWPGPDGEDYNTCPADVPDDVICAEAGDDSSWPSFDPRNVESRNCPQPSLSTGFVWPADSWTCYETEIQHALQRAARLSEALLIYIFDFRPPPTPPPPPSGNVDVMLIIDESNSMETYNAGDPLSDPERLRVAAAKFFVDLARPGDRIGIVGFAGTARVLAPLTPISPEADRTSLKEAIDGVRGDRDATDIGGGIAAAFLQLDPDSTSTAAILLTDGAQFGGGYRNQHEDFAAKGWPIFAVGLGPAQDADLMQRIADETNGQYFDAPSNIALQEIYRIISSGLVNETPVLGEEFLMQQDESETLFAQIESATAQVTFSSTWSGSTIEMTLTGPDGSAISPETRDGVYHARGDTYELYRVTNPQPGQWAINLVATDVPPEGELVVVTATVLPAEATPSPTPTPTATNTPTPQVLIGDVDCTGIINAIDALFILQFFAALITSLPCPDAADANLDGNVDPLDALLVLQYDAGIIDSLPP